MLTFCIFIFLRQVANNWVYLSPQAIYSWFNFIAEPQRQFEIAFKMMDVDGNGYIDKSEFVQV